MKEFIVLRKIYGVQQLVVNAKNKTHAKKLVDSWDESVQGLDFHIEDYGKAFSAFKFNNKAYPAGTEHGPSE